MHWWKLHHASISPESLMPLYNPSVMPSAGLQATMDLLSTTIDLLAFSRIVHKFNHTIYSLFSLARDTSHDTSDIHPCWSTFILLSWWVECHGMDIPRLFTHLSIHGHIDYFHYGAKTDMNIRVQVFVCACAFIS